MKKACACISYYLALMPPCLYATKSIIKKLQHNFPKMRGGVKGCLEFFQKVIRFGSGTLPLSPLSPSQGYLSPPSPYQRCLSPPTPCPQVTVECTTEASPKAITYWVFKVVIKKKSTNKKKGSNSYPTT